MPEESQLAVAFDEAGKPIGFGVATVCVHFGPFFVEESHRGNGVAGEIAAHIDRRVPEGMCGLMVTRSAEIETIAQRCGMRKAKGTLYIKEY